MKIGIVTWISYQNYGTILQAYAMQQALEGLGHEAKVLSDQEVLRVFRQDHPFPKELIEADRRSNQVASAGVRELLRHPGRLLRSVKIRLDREGYAEPFESSRKAISDFVERELALDADVTPENLAALNDRYDAFVCGSDQIWSLLPENFNPYYYLSFAAKSKLAYAPSLGTDRIPAEAATRVRELLADFRALAVRESRLAEELRELLGREVAWVADPTLLHDRSFWADFASIAAPTRRRYLLCYFLQSREWYFDRAEQLAKALGLKLVLLPSRWEHLIRGCVETKTVGLREFVAYFRDAACVLTDSYHGMIFSMLFEKNFQYLRRFSSEDPRSQNLRVESLLSRLELRDRIVGPEDPALPVMPAPDYKAVSEKLAAFRASSLHYLAGSLSAIQEEQL